MYYRSQDEVLSNVFLQDKWMDSWYQGTVKVDGPTKTLETVLGQNLVVDVGGDLNVVTVKHTESRIQCAIEVLTSGGRHVRYKDDNGQCIGLK